MTDNFFTQIEKFKKEALEYYSRALPENSAENVSEDTELLKKYISENPGRGSLKLQVTNGNSLLPIKDAAVEIYKDYENVWLLIYKKQTDESGIVDGMILPALPAVLSQNEETAEDGGNAYAVRVSHPLYEDYGMRSIVIYDKVKTILPVALQPKIV